MMNLDDLHILNGHKPNFTIMLPGGCNAKCNFCFWNSKDGKIHPPVDYFVNLENTINMLPRDTFSVVSVTGGEPSLSKYFDDVIHKLYKSRWDRIVLTTNGSNIEDNLMNAGITHVNLSRHHYNDGENFKIFKTEKMIPSTLRLKNIDKGLIYDKLSINCIIDDSTQIEFIMKMIEYCVDLGVKRIVFRRVASDIAMSPVEELFGKLFKMTSNDCPVCRNSSVSLYGIDIIFKAGYGEPSKQLNKVYEAVFHPDGKLYADWARKIPLSLTGESYTKSLLKEIEILRDQNKVLSQYKPKPILTGCGGKVTSGCGGGSCGG